MIDIMTNLGVSYKIISGQVMFQSICHNSDSYKLYYYDNEDDEDLDPNFHCFSSCGSMSIFDLIMKVEGYNFIQAINFYCDYLGINKSISMKRTKGFNIKRFKVDDDEYLNQFKIVERVSKQIGDIELEEYSDNVFKVIPRITPKLWRDEGISPNTMRKYGVRLLEWKNVIVIPHIDAKGRLIGIRIRNLLDSEVIDGRKYKPLFFENQLYSHPLQYNLYGLYYNRDAIIRQKKVMLVEGEKSVLKGDTFYGDDNFTLALCGGSFSDYQRNILIFDLGVEEVFIALDKEHKENMTDEEEKKADRHDDKIRKIISKLKMYCKVHVIYDTYELLEYKDSPLDGSREVLEQLMREKITVE